MNNYLSRPDHIDSGGLRRGDYFVSLLEQAQSAGIIDEDTVDGIKIQCIKLLGEMSEHYTSGESSSVTEAAADMLLKNILYIAGVSLKAYSSPDTALSYLLDKGVGQVCTDGRIRISQMLSEAKEEYSSLRAVLVPLNNRTYNETILQGIKGFFKKYDTAFAAQDTVITADYPAARDLSDLSGIEFIYKYIFSLSAENAFLRRFSSDNIQKLFESMDRDWGELVINIFIPVLCQATGCALAGRNHVSLYLDGSDIVSLKEKLRDKSREDIYKSVTGIYDSRILIADGLDKQSEEYVRSSLSAVASEIYTALRSGTVQRVFTAIRHTGRDEKTVYRMGGKMDDEKYRELLDKLSSLTRWAEKQSVITHNIKSLADYDDLLLDAEFSEDEAFRFLKALHPADIAALCVKYSVFDEAGYDYSDREEQSRTILDDYLLKLPDTGKNEIKQLADNMEIR